MYNPNTSVICSVGYWADYGNLLTTIILVQYRLLLIIYYIEAYNKIDILHS